MDWVIYRRTWRGREDVEWAVADWVQWYNTKRLLGPIGYIPPAEAEAAFYAETSSSRCRTCGCRAGI